LRAKEEEKTVETVAPYKEIVDVIKASGGDAFKRCFQCGLCDVVCPWNKVRSFSMRKLVREATFGLTEIESEDIWRCTTCGRCPQQCPRDVRQIDSGVALRRVATEYGVFPKAVKPVRTVNAGLVAQGNPFGEDREKRGAWAEGLSVNPFTEGMEYLYFPGCYLSYDPRSKKVAKATATIFNKAGVDYGILGSKENCCGESIRKTGDEALVNFEVLHVTQLLFQLMQEGKLEFTKEYGKKVAYHDPCYLGRHNGIFEEPREILKKVPGLELEELPESRMESLCCGGGGGRVWMETVKGERFSDLRMEQALGVGAEVLVTACPYCITMFEDSRLTLNVTEKIEVKDITEILQEVI
jgi:Fe-S oxidoreductase